MIGEELHQLLACSRGLIRVGRTNLPKQRSNPSANFWAGQAHAPTPCPAANTPTQWNKIKKLCAEGANTVADTGLHHGSFASARPRRCRATQLAQLNCVLRNASDMRPARRLRRQVVLARRANGASGRFKLLARISDGRAVQIFIPRKPINPLTVFIPLIGRRTA